MKKILGLLIGLLMVSQVYGQTIIDSTSKPYLDTECNKALYYPLGSLCQDIDDGKLYKGTGSAVTEIFSGTSIFPNATGIPVYDSNSSHYIGITTDSNITANRLLKFNTGDSARTVTLSGNPTLDDWFDQAVKAASTPSFGTVTLGTTAILGADGAGVLQIGADDATATAQKIKGPDSSTALSAGGNLSLQGGTPGAGGVYGAVILQPDGGTTVLTGITLIGTTTYAPQKLTVWDGGVSIQNTGTLGSTVLTDGTFTLEPGAANWTLAGTGWDAAFTGAKAVYAHSGGTGTLVQDTAKMVGAVDLRANRWYKFVYTVSSVTAGCTVTIPSTVALTAQTLTITAATDAVIYFLSAAAPNDFVIAVTSTAGGFSLDALALYEVQGGDLHVGGTIYAANGSNTLPSITFGSDINTGFFRTSADVIGITVGGSVFAYLGAERIRLYGNSQTIEMGAALDVVISRAGTNQMKVSADIWPATDNTYYLGKNDDDTPFAWKGVILKDTTNGKYYRVEVISGVVTATDLTD